MLGGEPLVGRVDRRRAAGATRQAVRADWQSALGHAHVRMRGTWGHVYAACGV